MLAIKLTECRVISKNECPPKQSQVFSATQVKN